MGLVAIGRQKYPSRGQQNLASWHSVPDSCPSKIYKRKWGEWYVGSGGAVGGKGKGMRYSTEDGK